MGQTKQHAERWDAGTEWPGDLVAGIGVSIKATGNETANQISFLHYPLSSVNYCQSYSRVHREHLNGFMLGWNVSCTCFHQNKKKKNQRSSFPHKAQDKINPTYRFKAKMSVFLAFVSLLSRLQIIGTQAHYSWQKIPLLYKIKLLILTFILIQFCRIELKWLL